MPRIYPGMTDVNNIKFGSGPNDAIKDDAVSIKYHRKIEMAKMLFQSLYGRGVNVPHWDKFITSTSGIPVQTKAMPTSNRTTNAIRDARGGAEILASFFESRPSGKLQIFMPEDKQFHYITYNKNADTYEISDKPVPIAIKEHIREDNEKLRKQIEEIFTQCTQSPTFDKDRKSAQDVIDAEYKANYKNRVVNNVQPEVQQPPKQAAPKIERPEFLSQFPSRIPVGEDLEDWARTHTSLQRQIPYDKYSESGYSKYMAASKLLTALYGGNPSKWKETFITTDGKPLENQKLNMNSRFRMGSQQKDPAGNLAGFFESNPNGKLVIYSPADNKLHELSLSQDGVFNIDREEYEPSYLLTNSEKANFKNLLTGNQQKFDPMLSGDNLTYYKQETSAAKYLGKNNIEAVRAMPVQAMTTAPATVKTPAEVQRASGDYQQGMKDCHSTMLNAMRDIIKACDENQIPDNVKAVLTDIKNTLYDVNRIQSEVTSRNFYLNFGDADAFRASTKKASDQIRKYLNSSKLSKSEKPLADALSKVQNLLNDPSGVIAQTQRGLDIIDNIPKQFALGHLNDYGKGQSLQSAYFGKAPSATELMMMDPLKSDPQKLVRAMIWCTEQEYMNGTLLGGIEDPNPNFYRQQSNRLFKQLDKNSTLPFDTLAEYASLLTGAKINLAERVYNIYNNAKANVPKEETNPEAYACKVMSESDAFLAYKALEAQINGVGLSSSFGLIQRGIEKRMLNNPLYKGSMKLEALNFMQNIKEDSLKEFFEKSGYKPETLLFESPKDKEKMKAKLEESGYNKPVNTTLVEAYIDLINDKQKASESFKAMRDTMSEFIKVEGSDLGNEKARFEYERKLAAAEKAASEYYKSHNRHHITENGDKRLDISDRLVGQLKDLKSTLAEYNKSQPVSGYKVQMAFKQQLGYLDSKKIDEKQFMKNVQSLAKPLLAAKMGLKPEEVKGINDKYLAEAFENLDMEDFRTLADTNKNIKEFDKISELYGYIARNDVTSEIFKQDEKIQEVSATLAEYVNDFGKELQMDILEGKKEGLDIKLATLAYVSELKDKLEKRELSPKDTEKAMKGDTAKKGIDKLLPVARDLLKKMPTENIKTVAEMDGARFSRIMANVMQNHREEMKAEIKEPEKSEINKGGLGI